MPSPLDGYTITQPEWEVRAFPDGEYLKLKGTIQEVRRELLKINPNWDNDFVSKQKRNNELEKRTDFSNSNFNCFGRWGGAQMEVIEDGIEYLRGVDGRPNMGPGPGNCGRVSCSYNSGIYWCNDADETKTLNSFGSIADGAQKVVDECQRHILDNPTQSSGQVFHYTDWNVIVTSDVC
ncbi:uncharacterized protein BJX67DRAFT_375715 [Aspergillus lucknowensis]|uniref:Uncharacterized protein n=1 Tax=Aspergillus lucknowensis TaxID=176173 RepID=A0ABR4L8R3_9EURO